MKNNILEYFLKYVKIDTMSMEDTGNTPSTRKQFDLAYVLKDDLKDLGLININIDEHAFVTAELPSNVEGNKLSIGFIAHMDTIPGFSGTNVKPNVIYNYKGNDIKLKGISITKKQFPFLENLIGKTIITTDGTTVLGADDKAGIADIMGMLHYFKENPNVPHCRIMVAFTPDEEIGEGIEKFNLDNFKCDFAYTVDGGSYNEINYENFNAASATVIIKGLDIHPGSAKNQMINASLVAMEFNGMLNVFERPEYTEGYEGFNHLCGIEGAVGEAKMFYILRNHNKEKLEQQKNEFKYAKEFINKKYDKDLIEVIIKDSYSNMAEYIKKDPKCIDRATKAMNKLNIVPEASPIRGGTDGAKLTLMGLNTPNLGTGGYNCHGPYEIACLEEMETVAKLLIEIAKI